MQSPEQNNNQAIAFIFQQMARCYRYLGGEPFRASAYEKAAAMLSNMQEDIADYAPDLKRLEALGNIGVSIAKKITEYLQTGKIGLLSRLKKRVPYELLELMDIAGFGRQL
ncbi:hypothetical protein LL912_02610 [Niabella sp. CC-SYL272]|uniref:hypothetical protein n=1 Tax=Niabella agricola TaxID=2891571 RepID=UPI00210280F1|nr:hypothetical protein [Niabella agricola]MCF3107663.1 hypothetical protein [Niabella agricola]